MQNATYKRQNKNEKTEGSRRTHTCWQRSRGRWWCRHGPGCTGASRHLGLRAWPAVGQVPHLHIQKTGYILFTVLDNSFCPKQVEQLRYEEINSKNRRNLSYLPVGTGTYSPRQCIALDPQIPVLLACRYQYLLTSSVQHLDPQIPTYLKVPVPTHLIRAPGSADVQSSVFRAFYLQHCNTR